MAVGRGVPLDRMVLLTREAFREACLVRDNYQCINCGRQGQDVHHILERRLWPDGGYYLSNGATLCGACHLQAEETTLTCERLREQSNIPQAEIVLPPHLYPDERYDKWGNVILPTGRRLKGELFEDPSVQKVLAPVLHLFDNRVKYPRTWHLPWSPNVSKDDRLLSHETVRDWIGTQVVITEKMDGENTTLYRDYMHARSVDYSSHVTRNWMRAEHARIAYDIPDSMRICGENVSFKHSVGYEKLPSFFLVFSIWEGLRCLSWRETLEWCALLGLHPVPVLYRGTFELNDNSGHHWWMSVDEAIRPFEEHEGYVVRPAEDFTLRDFSTKVGKYVRKNHVQTHGHWMRSRFTPNIMEK